MSVFGQELQVAVNGGVNAQAAAEKSVVAVLVGGAKNRRFVEQVIAERLGEVAALTGACGDGLSLAKAGRTSP